MFLTKLTISINTRKLLKFSYEHNYLLNTERGKAHQLQIYLASNNEGGVHLKQQK